MVGTLAEAGAVLGREDFVAAAAAGADFMLEQMVERPAGAPLRLMRTWKDGEAKLNGYLEDYAFLVEALVSLYEATFESRWLAAAREVAEAMAERFWDPVEGGFFSTASDHEELIARRKEIDDNPIPSGNSAAALGLLRLYALTAEPLTHRVGDLPGRQQPAALKGRLVERDQGLDQEGVVLQVAVELRLAVLPGAHQAKRAVRGPLDHLSEDEVGAGRRGGKVILAPQRRPRLGERPGHQRVPGGEALVIQARALAGRTSLQQA